MFAIGCESGHLFVFLVKNAKTSLSKHVAKMRYDRTPVTAVSIMFGNAELLSSHLDGTVNLWSPATSQRLKTIQTHGCSVWDAKFAPLGGYFMTGSADKLAKLWHKDLANPLRIFVGHILDVHLVRWHPNHHYIATSSQDGMIFIWSVLTGEAIKIL